MSSIIEGIIERHVPRQYRGSREVAAVVADLNTARNHAAQTIRTAARRAGISEQDVNTVLIDAGLVDRPTPPPAPAAQQPAGEGGPLESQFARLVAFARQHGYRG